MEAHSKRYLRDDIVNFRPHLMKRIFYIFVPQAVDKRIQHGDKEGIKYGGHFITVKGMTGLGLQVHKQ